MRSVIISIAILCSFSLMHLEALGCDCLMQPVTSYIKPSEYILLVKVKRVHPEEISYFTGFRATVTVTKVFKGGARIEEELNFDSIDNSDCSFVFKPDQEYLVFAYKKDDKYYVYRCSYSDSVSLSKKNIQKIEKYLKKNHSS